MFEVAKFRMPGSATSAFVSLEASRKSQGGVWAEAGSNIELAYRRPLPMGTAARAVITLAIAAATKLCTAAAVLW